MPESLIGILGGVGPEATAYLSMLIIQRTDASCDQEHVRTLVFNDSQLPDRSAFITGKSTQSPLPQLIADAQLLERCGCSALAMPCNTAHYFWEDLQNAVSVPFLNMIALTARTCSERKLTRICVLATEGTVRANLYQRALSCYGISCCYPESVYQEIAENVIFHGVKAGRDVSQDDLFALVTHAAERACDGIILGCTELSCAFAGYRYPDGDSPVIIDALTVLADEIISVAGVRHK